MPPANRDRHRRSSRQPDKRRKKFRGQQGNTQKEQSTDNSASSRSEDQSVVSQPVSFRLAGNRSDSEPISQSPFSPTLLQRPSSNRQPLQSLSETAIGHTHMKKKSSSSKKDKKKEKDIRDSHPLNLPPDELQRLSAAMAAQEGARSSMDVDSNGQPTSPIAESPATPLKSAPGAFPDNANGTVNGVNGDYGDEKSPTPPPHRVPMPEKPAIDAEAAKAAGNKFFKAKDYSKAIAEYTKGNCGLSVPCLHLLTTMQLSKPSLLMLRISQIVRLHIFLQTISLPPLPTHYGRMRWTQEIQKSYIALPESTRH
jgi:hypothetical protein